MGKLLEKIIADRLLYILEVRNLINNNQAGFRPNRCTTDQVLKLVQQASDQLHKKSGDTRLMTTFFDYEKAYDKVWRDGLLYKMETLNIPARFIRLGVGYTSHFSTLSSNQCGLFFLITYHPSSKKHQRFVLEAKNKNAPAIFVLEAQKLLNRPKMTIFWHCQV